MGVINIQGREFSPKQSASDSVQLLARQERDYRKIRQRHHKLMVASFGKKQVDEYRQALKVRKGSASQQRARKTQNMLDVVDARPGVAGIKLNQANIRCPWILFRVLAEVGQSMYRQIGYYGTIHVNGDAVCNNSVVIGSWQSVAQRIRQKTGTSSLPKGMSEQIKTAFAHILTVQNRRAAFQPMSPCFSVPHDSSEISRRLFQLHTNEVARKVDRHFVGPSPRTYVSASLPAYVHLGPRGHNVIFNAKDRMHARKLVPDGIVRDFLGVQRVVTSAQRWHKHSEYLVVDYLSAEARNELYPVLRRGWARPHAYLPRVYVLAKLFELTEEIRETLRKYPDDVIDESVLRTL